MKLARLVVGTAKLAVASAGATLVLRASERVKEYADAKIDEAVERVRAVRDKDRE